MAARLLRIVPPAVCLAAILAAPLAAAEGFFEVRKEIIALYGDVMPSDLAAPYERSRVEYRDTGQAYFLHRLAAIDELAGLEEAWERHLREIFQGSVGEPFILYYSEFHRSRGTLRANLEEILAKVKGLAGEPRRSCIRSLCSVLAWGERPDELAAMVRETLESGVSTDGAIFFSKVLYSWGEHEEAVARLLAAAGAADESPQGQLAVISALRELGAGSEARRAAAGVFERFMPSQAPDGMALTDVSFMRRARLSRLCDIAKAGVAWGLLLEALDGSGRTREALHLVDRAVVFEAAGFPAERAEALSALSEAQGSADARALYGSALVQAGDAWTGRGVLLGAIAQGAAGEDAYYDLLDSLISLGDAAMLKGFAALYSVAFGQPQQDRLMADLMRAMGEYPIADPLFNSFIEKTGLGSDTRFAWQGARLLAIYYLDTGRLGDGREAAWRALDRLVEDEQMRGNMRSPVPEQFVELFARFGAVEGLVDYCRRRRGDYPEAVLIDRIEITGLEYLGRWDEALALERRMCEARDAVNRDLFMASANARAGRWEEAARLYKAAIDADPQVPPLAYEELGRAYAELGRWAQLEESMSAGRGGAPATLLGLALLYVGHGEMERASRVYERLDYLPREIDAKDLAPAVKFWVVNGAPERAASALARRVAIQTDLESKKAYIREAMADEASMAVRYIELGRLLEKGKLSADTQLLAYFYKELALALETALDPLNALEAWRCAWRLDGDDPGTRRSVATFATGWRPEVAAGAAAEFLAKADSDAVRVAVARAAFELGRTDEGLSLLGELSPGPLAIADAAAAVDVLEKYAPESDIYERLVESMDLVPWTLRARAADAYAGAGGAGGIVGDGPYVARALWAGCALGAAGKLVEADWPPTRFGLSSPHPAVELLRIDIALRAGRPADARKIAAGAVKAFGAVEPVKRLFEGELRTLNRRQSQTEKEPAT